MKKTLLILGAASALILAGCDESKKPYEPELDTEYNTEMKSPTNQDEMGDYTVAENPTFPIGTTVIIKSEHNKGMKDAKATIVGAYETVAYSVTYKPSNGEPEISDSKWIVDEEIVDENDVAFEVGDKVTTTANRQPGMQGTEVTIETVRPTTVYMVDYVDSTNDKKVSNYKWLIEDELIKEK
ncbi:YdhK family protein [Oceanisphaera avium]|uniref:DUF1541 domain-containing protein n=1 Tax=Oceanisphaera avium TaxID=1903694 RepID=A0A1Y0CVV6_9GAMM|nr:YdhK family protein [Oceanisphaera avium]ART79015.1 hypothetical protein CBP12_01665 [Oceanisphaera avium]